MKWKNLSCKIGWSVSSLYTRQTVLKYFWATLKLMFVKWYMKYFICWTTDLQSSKLWSSQLRTQFKQLRIEAWKSQDFKRVWTSDLAILVRRSHQLSYETNDPMTLGIILYQYILIFIYHLTSIPHRLIRTHKWPAPNVSGFIAQLVRASHWYREVTGSNPVEVLTFSGFYTQ